MIKKPLIALVILAAWLAPAQVLAQTMLDEISAQLESNNIAPGEPTITLDDLRTSQETQAQPSRQSSFGGQADSIGSVSDGIDRMLDTSRLIDPVTGRIDGAIEGVTGKVNGAIDRALNHLLSPIDGAIEGVFDKVDGSIDKAN